MKIRDVVTAIPLLLAAFGTTADTPAPAPAPAPREELRGLWVDSFHPGIRNEEEVRHLVDDAKAAGFNALFVEVRKRGEAYYESSLEPKAADVAPGFDPLGFLLERAHDTSTGPRLAVHAWMVAFNIWGNTTNAPAQPSHPYRQHPDWLTRDVTGRTWDGANYAFDPGHPAVQAYTFDVVMDLLRRYPVDGLHWDYIRYAGNEWGYHEIAVRRFNSSRRRTGQPDATDPDWLQFRRDQVTALVRKVYLRALAERPRLAISAATIAFAPGIRTTSRWPRSAAYSDVLQDWRAWMEEGILDWNVPMTYFRQTEHPASFADWNDFIKDHQYGRRALIGVGCYLNPAAANLAQIALAREPSEKGHSAAGVMVYSYAGNPLDTTRTEFFRALRQPSGFADGRPPFAEPAVVPEPSWKSSARTGHLHGVVTFASHHGAVDGAEVRLQGPVERRLTTDATGYFGAVDLPPGDYTVVASHPRFEAASADVPVQSGRVAPVEFQLSLAKSGSDRKATDPGTESRTVRRPTVTRHPTRLP